MTSPPDRSGTGRRPDLLDVRVEGSLLVVDPTAGTAYVLNPSAAQVWDLCHADRGADEIAARLSEHLGIAADALVDDVRATVEQFERSGLLAAPGGPPGRRWAPTTEDVERVRPPTIDRPGWRALAHRFSVSCDDPELVAAVARDLRALPTTDVVEHAYRIAGADGAWGVECDGEPIAAAESPADALAALHRQLRQRGVEQTDDHLVLHAAAIRRGHDVVALPPSSGGGKSTLVTALVERGHAYLTDEAISLPLGSRRVVPLALPITLDAGSWELFEHLEPTDPWSAPTPLSWAWRLLPDPAPSPDDPAGELSVCVFHRYRPGAATSLERLGITDALVAAVECTFGLDRGGQATLDALAALVPSVDCYRLVHGDLDEAVAAVESVMR
jgi:hypothetical protein